MKKASQTMLALFLAFTCVILGILIGRKNAGTLIAISGEVNTGTSVIQSYDYIEHSLSPQAGKININTATVSQLQNLPNIGKVLAQRIVDYRTAHGEFHSIDDLTLVEGIGEKRLEQIRQYITIGG